MMCTFCVYTEAFPLMFWFPFCLDLQELPELVNLYINYLITAREDFPVKFQTEGWSDKMSYQGSYLVGHWRILVGHCPMTDCYLKPCFVRFKAMKSCAPQLLVPPVQADVWGHGGLMVSVLDSGSNGPGLSPGRGTVLCSWAKYFLSQCLSPPRCINEYQRIYCWQ